MIVKDYTLSNDEWGVISPLVPERVRAGNVGREPLSKRVVFEAMLRWLADAIPRRRCSRYLGVSYDTLANTLDEWVSAGLFEALWRAALENHDELCGLNTALLLIDGCITTAPNGGEATGRNPTDRAKSGAKRSVLTTTRGVPVSVVIDGANRHDCRLLAPTLAASLTPVAGATISADNGYRGAKQQAAAKAAGATLEVHKRDERPRPRRHAVECSHQRLNKFRGIKCRALRLASRWLALLQLACAITTWRATSKYVIPRRC